MRSKLLAGFAVLSASILLSMAWGKGDDVLNLLFIFLIPLLLFEHLSKEGIAVKFLVGLTSFLLFHLVNGLNLFTRANMWVVLLLLFLDSLRMSIPWLVYVLAKTRTGLTTSLFLMGTYWLGMEFLSYGDWGSPWYILGNSLAGKTQWVQWYQLTGALGGTLWLLLLNCVLFISVVRLLNRRLLPALAGLFIVGLLVIGPVLFSEFLRNEAIPYTSEEGVVVLSTGTDDSGLMRASVGELISATERVKSNNTGYIVWPESSMKNKISVDEMDARDALKELRNLTGGNSSYLICGATTVESGDYYNSALIVRNTGTEVVHKSNLAPFGEFPPPLLGWLELYEAPSYLVRRWEGDHLTGAGLTVAICYETLFGEVLADRALRSKASVIVMLSNETQVQGAKEMLLQLSQLRAIESRKYVLRSVHNGMSAIIAPDGGLLSWVDGSRSHIRVLTDTIRPNLAVTFYMENGDYIGRSALWLSVIIALFLGMRKSWHWRRYLFGPY